MCHYGHTYHGSTYHDCTYYSSTTYCGQERRQGGSLTPVEAAIGGAIAASTAQVT